jgi:hypothetical protein
MPGPSTANPFAAWPADARKCVERSVERHGGWERWKALETVSLRLRTLSGMVPWSKGLGRTFPAFSRVLITPHEFVAVFEDYPEPGHRIEFARGAVSMFEDARAAPTSVVADPRPKFSGLAKYRRWTPSDAAYFFGYALTYYTSMPFLFARTVPVGFRRSSWKGHSSLTVDFPDDVVTHCRRQRFFFAEDGRIVRHDYVADIIGPWARGCHLWEDYVESEGLLVPRTRHVLANAFDSPSPLVALHAELSDVRVTLAPLTTTT